MKKYVFALSVLIPFVWISCQPKQPEKKSDLQFTINPDLLGFVHTDTNSGFTVSIPKGWLPLSAFDSVVQNKFTVVEDSLSLGTIYLDSLQQGGSVFIYSLPEADTVTLAKIYQNPDSAFNQQKIWQQILKSTFYHNGLRIRQYLLQSNDLVTFKLVITEGTRYPVQLDYVLSRNTYMQHVKKIESSIGSINSL
ncbi:MAG: hypothetical protein O9302_14560 [Cyclobacteriaceae bacterium]|jgi:hypothetical protein|nr:hypothetical protein [Cytophagales bacterium]MCZ8329285.1 hypothetical protein [Cyclobacteriaceae bacterium]